MQMKIKKTNLKTHLVKITKMDEDSQKNQEIVPKKRDDKLKSFIERLERLSDKKNNINFDIKEVFLKQNQVGMIQQ